MERTGNAPYKEALHDHHTHGNAELRRQVSHVSDATELVGHSDCDFINPEVSTVPCAALASVYVRLVIEPRAICFDR
jgi:hypothetical protein